MALFTAAEFSFASAVAELNYTNPFGAERIALERQALGAAFEPEPHAFWAMMRGPGDSARGNVLRITDRARHLAEKLRGQMLDGMEVSDIELGIYDDLVLYQLFYHFFPEWGRLFVGGDAQPASEAWRLFREQADYWLQLPVTYPLSHRELPHMFAMLYQVYRAFYNIFDCVVGHSAAAARLRCQIWQSIFTHDLRRYRRSLYANLHEVTTLVTGPSGSGKELVAQAIGRSRYIPFAAKKQQFEASASDGYIALNISAFSANLIESELFGHAKGAYTGAEGARAGWLETSGRYGTILLDEIGELDATTQVKLLRVLQNRQFQRMGESKLRSFHSKIVAATNRNLRDEISHGTFREDLYYRLCADVVRTPSLAEHLLENRDALADLVQFITQRIAPGEDGQLTQQVLEWIDANLPRDYHWPGNIRELEQCIRNIMIHNHYEPAVCRAPSDSEHGLIQLVDRLEISADDLLTRYARLAYAKTGSYKRAAELLGVDRRTLKARCSPDEE